MPERFWRNEPFGKLMVLIILNFQVQAGGFHQSKLAPMPTKAKIKFVLAKGL